MFFFVGQLISLFWTSGDVCPGEFPCLPGWILLSLAHFLACTLFLRLTSGETSDGQLDN